MDEKDEGKISGFNEAQLKMMRIHKAQDLINEWRGRLLVEVYRGFYGYDMVSSGLNTLLMESKGKMSKDEQKTSSNWRDKLTKITETKRPHYIQSSYGYSGRKYSVKINFEYYEELKKALFECEDFVKYQLEKHGYSEPSESEGGFD